MTDITSHSWPVFGSADGKSPVGTQLTCTIRCVDPLAHSLFGAAMAKTRLGRDRALALPVALLAANVPDVDVLAYAQSADTALWLRRGWTHGPLGLLLLPALVAGLVLLVARIRGPARSSPDPRRLMLVAYLAAVSHPLLDWLNTYGVRLLMPFDERWYYGDALFIVDPWMWMLLGASVFLAHGSRPATSLAWLALAAATTALIFVAAEHWAGRAVWAGGILAAAVAKWRAWPARPAPAARAELHRAAVLAYAGAMTLGARAAAAQVRAAASELGLAPVERLMVGPLPLTPLRRDVVLATRDEIRVGHFDWLGRPRVVFDEWRASPAGANEVERRALADPCIRGFVNWARFPYAETQAEDGDVRVDLIDARYSRMARSGFGSASVVVPAAPADTSP
ncbi:MAG: metal-dependent hydrolase [Thermoanaerobaculia bacterium]|nr:metal-dependent hydrolase [Thermoanaerobaculia bacterium]